MGLGDGYENDKIAFKHPATLTLAIGVASTEIQQQHQRHGREQREQDEQAGGGEKLHTSTMTGRPVLARPPSVRSARPSGG